jgi:hypothetical protein
MAEILAYSNNKAEKEVNGDWKLDCKQPAKDDRVQTEVLRLKN